MLKKTLLLAGTSYFLVQRKTYCSSQPPLSMILRGSYENKIRRYSPPQKIFDVFATIYQKGNLKMSLLDLLKAICFYNYSMSDQTNIQDFTSPNIIKFLGKDNKFQIYDYFILARFLAYQSNKIQSYFKNNGVYQLNQAKFRQFLSNQVCVDYVNHIKQSLIMQSRQFTPSKQDFDKKIQIVSKNMFQNRQGLTARDINRKRKQMIKQLYQFQFRMFPIKDKTIDGADFVRSIIKYVQPNKTKKYMKRIKKMKQLENVQVDINAYKAFHTYLWQNMAEIQNIISKKGAISTEQLQKLINKYVSKKGSVSSQQINAVVKVLDWDDSGFLQKKQVLGVLKHMQYYTTVKSGQVTFLQSIKNDFEKILSKVNQIKEIIQQ